MTEPTPVVFVSYSYHDADVLRALKHELSSQKIHVWSVRDIGAGESWAEQVLAALETAGVYILLLSRNYLESKNAMFESGVAYARALNHEAFVIPVLLADVHLPPHLASLQYIDARKLPPSEIARRVRKAVSSTRPASHVRRTTPRRSERADRTQFSQMVAEADWNTVARRLLAFAETIVRQSGQPKRTALAAGYVEAAVRRLLDGEIADADIERTTLFTLLCREVETIMREDKRYRPRTSKRRAAVESHLDGNIELFSRMSPEEVEERLRELGIDPDAIVEAVSASVRMRQKQPM